MNPRLRLALVLFPVSLVCGHWSAARAADPPARVGRVARVSGTVSFRLAPDAPWRPAVVNLPVSAGTGLWTEPGAAAELGIGGTRLAADERTELDVTRLDDAELDVTAPQGRLCLHPASLPPGTAAVVQTPRAAMRITAAGHYEIVAGDTGHPTGITVLDGSARVTGPAIDVAVGANQTATIDGDGAAVPFRVALGAANRSAFLDACLRRERSAPPNRPAVVAQMSGWEALDEYGSWTSTPRYGAVWFPRDDPGYVPFRAGHWIFAAPWGWTWVDDAPWGFAPSHYGRWVQVDDRWGWIAASPGVQPGIRPVYVPAVVGFLAGAAIGASAGAPGGGPPVGWVPLAPQEPYFPPYRVSNTYIRNVNVTDIRNVSTVVQSFPRDAGPPRQGGARVFVNAAAATMAPAAAVQAGQPIAPVAWPVPPDALRQATPPGQPPQAPAPDAAPAAAPGPGSAEAFRGGRPALRGPIGAQTTANPAAAPPRGADSGPRPAVPPAASDAERPPVPVNGAAGLPGLREPDAARPPGREPPRGAEPASRPAVPPAVPDAERPPVPANGVAGLPNLRSPDAARPPGREPPRGAEPASRLAVPPVEHRPAPAAPGVPPRNDRLAPAPGRPAPQAPPRPQPMPAPWRDGRPPGAGSVSGPAPRPQPGGVPPRPHEQPGAATPHPRPPEPPHRTQGGHEDPHR